jgi:hypothetical protein
MSSAGIYHRQPPAEAGKRNCLQASVNNGDRWNLITSGISSSSTGYELSDDITIPQELCFRESAHQLQPRAALDLRRCVFIPRLLRRHRTEAGFRGQAGVSDRFSLEPGISLNWVDAPWGDTILI